MIASWKIRREITRLGQQFAALHETLWEPWVQRRHDQTVRKGLPVFEGAVTFQPKVALYLIYQPKDVPQSIVETCKFLRDHGFSPLIVANGGLSAENRALLLPHVWKILERPNVGYDFGGYRDGILQLQMWGVEPDKLLIMNDSIWFPIAPKDTFLDAMVAANADVTGTVLRRKNNQDFLESYLYLIDGRVMKNAAVRDYWQSYRLTSNKYKVIRRGERGHSTTLVAAGFKLHPMFTESQFLSQLRNQDNAFLEKTLRFGVAETAGLTQQHEALLKATQDDGWRSAVIDHIERVLQSGQFYSAFPYASAKLMAYPILKRSSDFVAALWRKAYLAAIEIGELDAPMPHVLIELKFRLSQEANI